MKELNDIEVTCVSGGTLSGMIVGAVDGAYDHAGKSSTRNAGDFNVIEFFHFIYLL